MRVRSIWALSGLVLMMMIGVSQADGGEEDPRVAEFQSTIASLQSNVNRGAADLERMRTKLEEVKAERDSLKAAQAEAVKKAGAVEQEAQVLNEELERVKGETKAAVDAARAEAEKLRGEQGSVGKELAASLKAAEAEKARLQEEVKGLKDANTKVESQLKSIKAELDKLKGEVSNVKEKKTAEVTTLASEADELRALLAEKDALLKKKEEELELKYTPLVLTKDTSKGIGMLVKEASFHTAVATKWATENAKVGSELLWETTEPLLTEGMAKAEPLVRQGSAKARELWYKAAEAVRPHIETHVAPHYEKHLKDHVEILAAKSVKCWVETIQPALAMAFAESKVWLAATHAKLGELSSQLMADLGKRYDVAVDWLNEQEAVNGQGEPLLTALIFIFVVLLLTYLRWQILHMTWFTAKLPFRTVWYFITWPYRLVGGGGRAPPPPSKDDNKQKKPAAAPKGGSAVVKEEKKGGPAAGGKQQQQPQAVAKTGGKQQKGV